MRTLFAGRKTQMAWETPQVIEIECGLEVTAYAPAPDRTNDEDFNADE
jgi:coenzyme PQQ precursor peptide PqqA